MGALAASERAKEEKDDRHARARPRHSQWLLGLGGVSRCLRILSEGFRASRKSQRSINPALRPLTTPYGSKISNFTIYCATLNCVILFLTFIWVCAMEWFFWRVLSEALFFALSENIGCVSLFWHRTQTPRKDICENFNTVLTDIADQKSGLQPG